MATILATAYDFKFSKWEGMKQVYEQLKRKVKAWVRSGDPWAPTNYVVPRVFWSCEMLDLKEVQDEIKVLASGPLLSVENPEDRRLVEQASRRARNWLTETSMSLTYVQRAWGISWLEPPSSAESILRLDSGSSSSSISLI